MAPVWIVLCLALSLHAQTTRPASRFDASTWRPLFDGTSLDGWTTKGGRYDGGAVWTVEDGVIVGREGPNHAGGLLYTTTSHASFVLSLDVALDDPFDSGVFVHMTPKAKGAQVTLDAVDGGEIGGIYSDGWLKHHPDGKAGWKVGDWNRVEVRCAGWPMRLESWLNGAPLSTWTMPADAVGFAPTGLIGIQVHGNRNDPPGKRARFRNLRLLELPVFDSKDFATDDGGLLAPTAEGRARGWRPLFDGRTLEGWSVTGGGGDAVVVKDRAIVVEGHGDGELRTVEEFGDFECVVDFRIGRMANSGLFLRADPKGGNPAFSGCELQILDDFNWEKETGSTLKPWQFTGSLYGSLPPSDRRAVAPVGMWNTYRVVYKGHRLDVELNGVKIHDAVDTHAVPVESSGSKPFAERVRRGFIGLQRHSPGHAGRSETLRFRNIFVRTL